MRTRVSPVKQQESAIATFNIGMGTCGSMASGAADKQSAMTLVVASK
jgi:hypothetical protein